jgi:hypothetical protein
MMHYNKHKIGVAKSEQNTVVPVIPNKVYEEVEEINVTFFYLSIVSAHFFHHRMLNQKLKLDHFLKWETC